MKIVIAGVLKKVIGGGSKERYPCPFREKPIKCKGKLVEQKNEDGSHRQHHGGYMPDMSRPGSITPDYGRDPVPKVEAQCNRCLACLWGASLQSISDHTNWLPQDIATWKNTREIKVMKRFPWIFPKEQIRRAEEQARR